MKSVRMTLTGLIAVTGLLLPAAAAQAAVAGPAVAHRAGLAASAPAVPTAGCSGAHKRKVSGASGDGGAKGSGIIYWTGWHACVFASVADTKPDSNYAIAQIRWRDKENGLKGPLTVARAPKFNTPPVTGTKRKNPAKGVQMRWCTAHARHIVHCGNWH